MPAAIIWNPKSKQFEVIGIASATMEGYGTVILKLGNADCASINAITAEAVAAAREESREAPTSVPGGKIISYVELLQKIDRDPKLVVISALDDAYGVPGAYRLGNGADEGTFDDEIQARLTKGVQKITGGDKRLSQ